MSKLLIRDLHEQESAALGRLMVAAYSALEGFPAPAKQPEYYEMLANIGRLTARKGVRVLVALTSANELAGGVVYFGDMAEYGSGGTATRMKDAAGIRLLAIHPRFQGMGAGRALTAACIELARAQGRASVLLHTTQAMQVAWKLYEQLGFERYAELDFRQGELPVFGFRLSLTP